VLWDDTEKCKLSDVLVLLESEQQSGPVYVPTRLHLCYGAKHQQGSRTRMWTIAKVLTRVFSMSLLHCEYL
jgi:hypothetical protein